jgi:GMP synthase (glutamine-hydrolysing)
LCERIDAYRNYGYFDPAEADEIKARGRAAVVSQPAKIVANFVARYRPS